MIRKSVIWHQIGRHRQIIIPINAEMAKKTSINHERYHSEEGEKKGKELQAAHQRQIQRQKEHYTVGSTKKIDLSWEFPTTNLLPILSKLIFKLKMAFVIIRVK